MTHLRSLVSCFYFLMTLGTPGALRVNQFSSIPRKILCPSFFLKKVVFCPNYGFALHAVRDDWLVQRQRCWSVVWVCWMEEAGWKRMDAFYRRFSFAMRKIWLLIETFRMYDGNSTTPKRERIKGKILEVKFRNTIYLIHSGKDFRWTGSENSTIRHWKNGW